MAKSIRRPITAIETRLAYALNKGGFTYKEVGKIMGRPKDTVNGMLNAIRAGYELPKDYLDHLAREKDFKDSSNYSQIKNLERNPKNSTIRNRNGGLTKQEIFEKDMALVNVEFESIPHPGSLSSLCEKFDVDDLGSAMDILKEKNPRRYQMVRMYYFEAMTHKEIGEEFGIGKAGAHAEIVKSKIFLKRVLTGTETSSKV